MTPPDSIPPRDHPLKRAASLALAGVLGFGLGVWAARSGRRSAGRRPGSREALNRFDPELSQAYMRRAIANARKAAIDERTGGPFGAVIVDREGRIVGEGSNHVIAHNDPTWHAEMEAIRTACAALRSPSLEGCVLYASGEPCPMCLAAAYWAGVDAIFFASTVDDAGKYGDFDDSFLYDELTRPPSARKIPTATLLRDEALEVWRQYAAQPDNTPY